MSARKPKQKHFAFVVFLLESDANRFLASFGFTGTTRLIVMGQPINCKRSTATSNQLQLKLNSARYEINKRQSQQQRPPEQPRTVFYSSELHCGHLAYLGGEQLAFISEWTDSLPSCGARFSKRTLVLWSSDDSLYETCVEAQIPYQTIVELIWWSQPSQMAVVLSTPPIFVKVNRFAC